MSFIDKCKAMLVDQHPENNESHAATRYAMQDQVVRTAEIKELERRIAALTELEHDAMKRGDNKVAEVWRRQKEKVQVLRAQIEKEG